MKKHVLMIGPMRPLVLEQLERVLIVHKLWESSDPDALIKERADDIEAFAAGTGKQDVDGAFMSRFPRLKQVSSFGVGYDDIDVDWAGKNGVIVTNTPDVLNEEVADTAIGLLLCTVRQLPQADLYVRTKAWSKQPFPLGQSLRDRTIGLVGMGRIGRMIARRLDAMNVPIAYHTRRSNKDVPYKHFSSILEMAKSVDVLLLIVPGGAKTRNLVNADVLKALGPRGILINVARGSVVDQSALVSALKNGDILTAGLDVFVGEPNVPDELIAMKHVVLFPHIGSSSAWTRDAMAQLVVDNLLAWNAGRPPLTPVFETPYPAKPT